MPLCVCVCVRKREGEKERERCMRNAKLERKTLLTRNTISPTPGYCL